MTAIAAETSLPVPIRSYVGRYVTLRRRHALLRAAGIATAFTIGWVLVCCAIDRAWPLPRAARVTLLSINVLVVIAMLMRPARRWVRRAIDWRAAAAEIERRDTRFAERLQTVTSELLAPPQQRGSAQFVAYLAGELNAELADDHPGRLLPKRPVVRPWLGAANLALFAGVLAIVPGFELPTLLARYGAPLASVAPPTTTQLTVEPRGIDLVEGQTVSIEAITHRAGSGGATLHYTKPGQPWAEFPMRPARPERFDAVLGPVDSDIRYYVTAGDARSDTYTARVVKRPTVREFRIDYVYPAHLNRPPSTAVNTDGFIEAPAGTEATVTVVASEPLASASLATGDRTLALTRGDRAEAFRGSFTIAKNLSYTLEMVSTSNVAGGGDGTMRISAIPDAPPAARLRWPTSALRLRPRDTVALHFEADDDNGVAAVTVRAARTPGHVDFSAAQPNLALKRPTTQSSTALGAGAERAVDGNTDGNFHAGSVTHTEMQPNPWWQVDLGESRAVWRVQIFNRTDAVSERLSDAVVFVSDAPIASDDPAVARKQEGVGAFDLAGPVGPSKTIDVFRAARFIRVQLQRPEYLSLAEVRVLGLNPGETMTATTTDAAVPLSGDPRRRQGQVDVSLATLGAQLGDVITLSIVATDTAGHAAATEPLRIDIMPHAASPDSMRRADTLDRAAAVAGEIVASLDLATTPAATQPATAPAPNVGRHVVRAAEQAAALRPALLDALADGLTGRRADAVAAGIDACVTIAAVAEDVYRGLGIDGVPAAPNMKRLVGARDAARLTAKRLRTLADGERAAAVLADVKNVAALDAAVPTSLEHMAAFRAQRDACRSDVAAGVLAVRLHPAAPDVAARLSERVRAADEVVPPTDFAHEPALVARRLAAAARAELRRVDVDPLRARDLQRAAESTAMDAAALARALATLQESHAIRRARDAGAIVLVRGLWTDAAARAARARLTGDNDALIDTTKPTRLDRLRVEQASLLRSTSARPSDVTHLAGRQEEVAATVERLIRARHTLAWGGRPPSDTRLQAIVAIDDAMRRKIADSDELSRALRPFQPETIDTLRASSDRLRPALAGAMREIVAHDPLLEAYAAARAAAVALRADVPDLDDAVLSQRRTAAALRRAVEAEAREAARIPAQSLSSIASSPIGAPTGEIQPATATTRPTLPAAPAASSPGYDDALKAYFEAIKR